MKQTQEWTRHAASYLALGQRPHFAPPNEVLAIHRREIARIRQQGIVHPHALVLGATPELADLALEHGCRVTRVDCNPAMFEAARARQRIAERGHETVVIGDWLDLHMIAGGSMDLVLGDAALNNVPHAQMAPCLAEIARITRTGGAVALKQIVLPDEAEPAHEFRHALDAWRSGAFDGETFYRILRFCSFTAEAYDPAEHLLDGEKVFAAIESRHAEGHLNDTEFEFFISRRSAICHTVYTQAEQSRRLARLGDCRMEPLPGPVFRMYVVRRGAP